MTAELAPVTERYGLLAEFASPEALLAAARATRQAGYRQVDAYSPFPIEELAETLHPRPTHVPLIVLIGGLLERIVYLNVGLSVILAFIGVKLIIEALHGSHIDDIGAIHLPHIGILTSLGFIVGTLFVTTVVSLLKSSRDNRREAVRVKIED